MSQPKRSLPRLQVVLRLLTIPTEEHCPQVFRPITVELAHRRVIFEHEAVHASALDAQNCLLHMISSSSPAEPLYGSALRMAAGEFFHQEYYHGLGNAFNKSSKVQT